MKLTRILLKFKTQFQSSVEDGDAHVKSHLSLILVAGIALLIWFGGASLSWEGYHPLAEVQKRLYIIVALALIWLLKYLILDLDTPTPKQYKDPAVRKAVTLLQKRFHGAIRFLKKTTVSRQGSSISLNQLPWYLLIGPQNAGKTSLLANSNINFILQRQFSPQEKNQLKKSDHCDWWVTREASIIDIPSRYFSESTHPSKLSILWDYYLRVVKDQRGHDAINGLIIALPLAEIIKQADSKHYQVILENLFRRLHEFKAQFPDCMPCYILMTKCDLLPGFAEYFAESGNDEVAQAWGVMLPQPESREKLQDLFITRFNALIKKLNQQLLWRMHQERNPMARPYIKDFPLQVERLKEFTLDFIKKFTNEDFNLYVKGIYLTSALQEKAETETTIIDDGTNANQRAVQIFKEPTPESRAFFIKQFLSQGVTYQQGLAPAKTSPAIWKRRAAYAASISVISIVLIVLGKDFNRGMQHTQAIKRDFANYEISVRQFNNPALHLQKTIALLNLLRQSAKDSNLKMNLASLMSFYSQKSQQKAYLVYKQALQNVLLPEIKNYFSEFIKTPINKNSDSVYAVLKAYLMLGDTTRLDKTYVANTLRTILPETYTEADISQLFYHLDMAIALSNQSQILDNSLVDQTRRYLLSLQGVPLAYIILKNINNNNLESTINMGINNSNNPALTSAKEIHHIPSLFTVKTFSNAFSQDVATAAQEALTGNWVLGENMAIARTQEEIGSLTEQLRSAYVTNYVSTWENILAGIQLNNSQTLEQTDALIVHLISDNSPLLQFLQTLHENTYFEPITTSSEKLHNLGLLVDKSNAPQNQLYQILVGLQSLHQYIQPALTPDNQAKKAFEIVSKRMLTQDGSDAITQVRLIAQQSPEPIKAWLEKITDDTWHYLMRSSTKYIDVSWQDEVSKVYQSDIANRYPFSSNQNKEVDIEKFTKFFGNPGIVVGFYNYYLKPFIDTSGTEWRWKQLDNEKMAVSDETLLQIQQGLKIHQAFFPNDDSKPSVQFTIQPYSFGKSIKTVNLNVNSKQILSGKTTSKAPQSLTWPSMGKSKMTSLELTMHNQQKINRDFAGEWGWFKLLNQSFDSAVSRKQIVVNFSRADAPAKYIIVTGDKFNPFMSMNLNHFHLPLKLVKQKSD